jgi:hypothetical protein
VTSAAVERHGSDYRIAEMPMRPREIRAAALEVADRLPLWRSIPRSRSRQISVELGTPALPDIVDEHCRSSAPLGLGRDWESAREPDGWPRVLARLTGRWENRTVSPYVN